MSWFKEREKAQLPQRQIREQENIQDVLLVPDLEENLLNVGQLIENAYALHFEGD